MKVKSLSHVRLLATPWTAVHQAPPSMGFSRQEYWSGVPLPSPTDCVIFAKCYFILLSTKSEKTMAHSLLPLFNNKVLLEHSHNSFPSLLYLAVFMLFKMANLSSGNRDHMACKA